MKKYLTLIMIIAVIILTMRCDFFQFAGLGSCAEGMKCTINGCVNATFREGCQRSGSSCYNCDPNGFYLVIGTPYSSSTAISAEEDTTPETKPIEPLYSTNLSSIENILIGDATSFIEGNCLDENFTDGYIKRNYSITGTTTFLVNQSGNRKVLPFGDNFVDLTSGTISLWVNMLTNSTVSDMKSQTILEIVGDVKSPFYAYIESLNATTMTFNLVLDGSNITSINIDKNGNWFHLYLVWGNGLENGKKLKLYIDKELVYSYSDDMPNLNEIKASYMLKGYVSAKAIESVMPMSRAVAPTLQEYTVQSSISMKKYKIWNQIVSDDPEYEYNQ